MSILIKPIRRIHCENVGLVGKLSMADDAPNFAEHNLIYGRNGSGKTVFANALWLSSSTVDTDIRNILEIKLRKVDKNGLVVNLLSDNNLKIHPSSVPIFVFNTEFVSQHVYDGSHTKLKGFDQTVVTAGSLQNPKIRAIEDEIVSLRSLALIYTSEIASVEELAKNIKEQISRELNSKIPGERMPTIPIPEIMKTDISTERYEKVRNEVDEHYSRYEQTKNQDLIVNEIESISQAYSPVAKKSLTTLTDLLRTKIDIKSNDIERKILEWREVELKHHSSQEWLEDGKNLLIENRASGVCPLCNSLLSKMDELIAEYENYFSSEADDLMNSLSILEVSARNILDYLVVQKMSEKALSLLEGKYLKELHNTLESKKVNGFELLESLITTALDLLAKRKQDISVSFSEEKLKDLTPLEDEIESLNTYLEKLEARRNTLTKTLNDLKFDRGECKTSLRKLFLASFDENSAADNFFQTHNIGYNGTVKGSLSFFVYLCKELELINEKLNSKVAERNKLLATLKRESKLVNDYLKKLSIHSFEVNFGEPNEDINITYAVGIVKQGTDNSLSEGEKSALAFAYFLSKFQHEIIDNQNSNAKLDGCVIVIDDPVSSLDEDRLFSTALVIRDEFSDSKQLFVLSHNLVFLKLFSSVMKGKTRDRRDYIVEKAIIAERPRSLRNFHTSYFYKYQKIIDFAKEDSLYESSKDFLPNYIRTVLETFLAFKFFRLHGKKYEFESPGLPELINVVGGNIGFLPNSSVNSINKTNILNELEHINRKVDSESHGTPQDLTEFEYISKIELLNMATKTLEIVEYLDGLHSAEITKER